MNTEVRNDPAVDTVDDRKFPLPPARPTEREFSLRLERPLCSMRSVGCMHRRPVDLNYPRVACTVFVDPPTLAKEVTRITAAVLHLRVMLSDERAATEADGPAAAQRLAAIYQQEFSRLPGYRIKMLLWNALPMMALGGMRFLSRPLRARSA